jgi:hypothetical protein
MRSTYPIWFFGSMGCAFAMSAIVSACANGTQEEVNGVGGGGSSIPIDASSSQQNACPPCLSNDDCGGDQCAQLGGDTYCAPSCSTSNGCASDRACTIASSYAGEQISVCVPRTGECSVSAGGGGGGTSEDSGASSGSGSGSTSGSSSGSGSGSGTGSTSGASSGSGSATTCGSLVAPTITASCNSCGSQTCQANGCYGGWWCDTSTKRCQAAPTQCASGGKDAGSSATDSGGTTTPEVDAGPLAGQVTASGGAVSRLYFAVIGDTRPASVDDTAGYPTTIIQKIFGDIQAASPRPSFAVSTGDYQFATPGKGTSASQLDIYMTARAAYSNVVFPAMGNHECNGYTASNCGTGNTDGVTDNFTNFVTKMLTAIGQSNPYYVIKIAALDNSWTSKFVVIAGNDWTSAEETWLSTTLAETTTYTFIIRHEAAEANTAPGVTPSEAVMAKYPYTLAIVGHTHTYEKSGAKQVIIGNGGAPLTGSKSYGYGLVQQRSDNAIQVDMIGYETGLPDTSFRFAVNADGSAATP